MAALFLSSPSNFLRFNSPECNRRKLRPSFLVCRSGFDFYGILGVGRGFSEMEIKRAYRNLVKKYHPDVAPAGKIADYGKRFVELNRAYCMLKDLVKKERYDSERVWNCRGESRLEVHRKGIWRVSNWETDQCW